MSTYSTRNETYIKPLKNASSEFVIFYNPNDGEITYSGIDLSGLTYPTEFDTITTNHLNVNSMEFTGTGAVVISSGNELRFQADAAITFNGQQLSSAAFSGSYNDLSDKPDVILKAELKAIVAASVDFADFKARIANL